MYYDNYMIQMIVMAFAIYGFVLLIVLGIPFILKGIGIHKMAKNAGFRSPWLAFVPFGQEYTVGLLGERALYCHRGRRRSLSKINLWLSVIRFSGFFGMLGAVFGWQPFLEGLLALIGFGAGIAAAVFYYQSLYYLYMDYTPGYELPFLLLSIFSGYIGSMIILLVHRDVVPVSISGTMPPRPMKYSEMYYGFGPDGTPPYGGYGGPQEHPGSPYPGPYPPQGPGEFRQGGYDGNGRDPGPWGDPPPQEPR